MKKLMKLGNQAIKKGKEMKKVAKNLALHKKMATDKKKSC